MIVTLFRVFAIRVRCSPRGLPCPHSSHRGTRFKPASILVSRFVGKCVFSLTLTSVFQPPRLVFVARAMDKTARFFLAFFTKGGLRINLIHPPSVVQDTIGHSLMDAFPDMIAYDEDIDHIRSIELKREATRSESCLLKFRKMLSYIHKRNSPTEF